MTDIQKVDFTKLLDRFHPGFFRSIDIYPGWNQTVMQLHELLVYLSPDYEISQIKTKFGGLRYYADFRWDQNDPDYETRSDIFYSLIHHYEHLSTTICEVCGSWGKMHNKKGWYYTACSKHEAHPTNHYLSENKDLSE